MNTKTNDDKSNNNSSLPSIEKASVIPSDIMEKTKVPEDNTNNPFINPFNHSSQDLSGTNSFNGKGLASPNMPGFVYNTDNKEREIILCPKCNAKTPHGKFCINCGENLLP